MSGSLILHHLRGHWVPVPDPMDWFADAAIIALAVLAVAVVVASVVKWRRGKHRADPAMKAVADRMVQVEREAAAAKSVAMADEKQIAWLRQSYIQLTDVLKDVFSEAGQELEEQPKPDLKVLKGGGAA